MGKGELEGEGGDECEIWEMIDQHKTTRTRRRFVQGFVEHVECCFIVQSSRRSKRCMERCLPKRQSIRAIENEFCKRARTRL